tara:strand:+ start:354 stop:587 length:234 start_codon:yes stop_codon:yes gene_type:complete
MPTYDMRTPTGEEVEVLCSIAEMGEKKKQGWTMVPTTGTIIRGLSTSGQGGGKNTSDSWKDTLRKIRDENPHSTLDI